MTNEQKLTLLIKVLKQSAEEKHCYDYDEYYHADFSDHPPEMIFDDGADYGEILFARTLLEQIGENFEYPCMRKEE
jgi:hypothetical protein